MFYYTYVLLSSQDNELLRSKLRSIPSGKFFCEPFIPAASCEVFWFKNKHYIGWAVNLRERIDKHNKGLVEATKSRRPFSLVYFEACLSKEKAILREKQLKSGFGRSYLIRRIS